MRRWQPQMLFRVRSSALIINNCNEILLVFHDDSITGEKWLMPPGGGLEAGENALEALVREVKEECGVTCCPKELLYVREYVSDNAKLHHMGLFFRATLINDEETIQIGHDPELENQIIKDCRYYSYEELQRVEVPIYPEILKKQFWKDLASGFMQHQIYLGQQRDREKK